MKRIQELSRQYLAGELTPREYRSAMIAQLSMLNDVETTKVASRLRYI